jgi:hypothetical protein
LSIGFGGGNSVLFEDHWELGFRTPQSELSAEKPDCIEQRAIDAAIVRRQGFARRDALVEGFQLESDTHHALNQQPLGDRWLVAEMA